MKKYNLAIIPGDGIGKEVVPQSLKVLETISDIHGGLSFNYEHFPWSSEYYVKKGQMMPDDGIDILSGFDSIILGAVGDPSIVPDHVSLWGLLVKIRRAFEQTINLRPAKYFDGLKSPLIDPQRFDIVVVRENSEGEYSEVGGKIHRGDEEIAIQNNIFTRNKVEKVMTYAFEYASQRGKQLTSATKSNGIVHSMPFWDNVFEELGSQYPLVSQESVHIDALSAFFVTKPETFDVIVASNLFGDILSDIGAAIMGSIGIAPSANINIEGKYPSMFEPVHGSAPDIVGKGIANPIGQIWSMKMFLDHIGEAELGAVLLQTIEEVTKNGVKTVDMGGSASTEQVTDEICRRLRTQI